MNNLEVILESILSEGNTKKDQILDEARQKADEIMSQSRNEANAKADEIINKAKREAKAIVENESVSAKRKSRDIEIDAKNTVIDRVVDKLLENLKNIDKESYLTYIKNSLKRSDVKDGEILLAANFKDALKDENFQNLRISDDTVEDGFVIRSGKIEYDNRFSSLIKYNIDDIRKEISDEIFK